jgi:translocator protein
MNPYDWYQLLIKPTWAPPGWIFGPIWTILYIVIFITFGTIFLNVINKKLPLTTALPFALNLVFNFAFTSIQFQLRNNFLAAIDILLILATIIWAITIIYSRHKWIAILNIPYLLWVLFATVLQLTITYLNI